MLKTSDMKLRKLVECCVFKAFATRVFGNKPTKIKSPSYSAKV